MNVQKESVLNAPKVRSARDLKAKKVTVLQDEKTMRKMKGQNVLKAMTLKGSHQNKKRKHLLLPKVSRVKDRNHKVDHRPRDHQSVKKVKKANALRVKRVTVLLDAKTMRKANALNALRVRPASVLLDVKRVRKVNARNALRVRPANALKAKRVTVLQDAKKVKPTERNPNVVTVNNLHFLRETIRNNPPATERKRIREMILAAAG